SFVCEPLNVVWQVARELDDRRSESGLGAHPGSREFRIDEGRELVGRNLVEPHYRARSVKGALRTEHPFHETRLRAGKHVPDLVLVLNGSPQGVLDRSAVESGDRLKLVERDHDRSTTDFRKPRRKGEHLLGEA